MIFTLQSRLFSTRHSEESGPEPGIVHPFVTIVQNGQSYQPLPLALLV
jgi:hypothetical protein